MLFTKDFWGVHNLRSYKSHKSFRPLTTLTYWIDNRCAYDGNYSVIHVFDSQPLLSERLHLINIYLHVTVVVLLYTLINIILNVWDNRLKELAVTTSGFKNVVTSTVISMIFSAHPVKVNAVSSVSGRAELLSCVFSVSTFALMFRLWHGVTEGGQYEKQQQLPRWPFCLFLGFVTATLGVASKETGIAGVFISLLYFLFKHAKLSTPITKTNDNHQISHMFIIIVTFMFVISILSIRIYLNNGWPYFSRHDNPIIYMDNQYLKMLSILIINAKALLLISIPWNSCTDYSNVTNTFFKGEHSILAFGMSLFILTVASAIVLGLFYVIWKRYWQSRASKTFAAKDHDLMVLGLLWLFIPFVPCMHIFLNVGFVIAERTLYTSCIGYAIIVGAMFINGYKIYKKVLRYKHSKSVCARLEISSVYSLLVIGFFFHFLSTINKPKF
jgi:hypothetical protein